MQQGPARGRVPDQVFEIRVAGAVPDDVLEQLAAVGDAAREVRTSLRARLRDQAELHGLLARLRTYGLEVVEVRRVLPGRDRAAGEP